MSLPGGKLQELKRMHRVADLLVSCHSTLRDRYSRRALLLDLAGLLISLWLVGMVFVDPEIATYLTPGNISPRIFLGILALGTFALSLIGLKVDWKGKASIHKQAASAYGIFKADAGVMLSDSASVNEEQFRDISRNYSKIGEHVVPIPDQQFNTLKKRHLIKVEISRILSKRPGRSIWCIFLSLWWRDNFRRR